MHRLCPIVDPDTGQPLALSAEGASTLILEEVLPRYEHALADAQQRTRWAKQSIHACKHELATRRRDQRFQRLDNVHELRPPMRGREANGP